MMRILSILLLVSSLAQAAGEFQTPAGIISRGHVSIGTPLPADPSAVLDIQSTNQGLAPPRMNASQMSAITNPVEGLVVYNTTSHNLYVYESGAWTQVGSGGGGGSTVWGGITGSITSQTDLQAALDSKQNSLGFTPINKAGDSMTGTLVVPAIKIPTSAANGYVLTTDALGNGTWQPNSGGGGSGANTSLSNLANPTAVNQDLTPQTSGYKLGTSSKYWGISSIGSIIDDVNVSSVDVFARNLNDDAGGNSVSWNTRTLYDDAGLQSINWESRFLGNSNGDQVLFWSGYGTSLSLSLSLGNIHNVADPTSAQDAATKHYVDNAVSGGGGANTTLSNLVSPVAINQSLLPVTNATYSLGAYGQEWNADLNNVTVRNQLNFGSNVTMSALNLTQNYTGNTAISFGGTGDSLSIDFNSATLHSVGDPTSPQDAATKNYVDTAISSGGANTTLSNLTSPTAANQSLLPGATLTYNLGSASEVWSSGNISNLFVNTLFNPAGTRAVTWSGTNLVPDGDLTLALGNSTTEYNGVYTSNLTGNDTLNISATGNLTLASGGNVIVSTQSIFQQSAAFQSNANFNGQAVFEEQTVFEAQTIFDGNEIFNGASIFNSSPTMNGNVINNVGTPLVATDAATKGYVDSVAGGASAFTTDTNGNLYAGASTPAANTGTDNVALGQSALSAATSGANGNTAVGDHALAANQNNQNNAFGQYALESTTTGLQNVGVGNQAFQNNITGQGNIGIGQQAGFNANSNFNSVVGYKALFNTVNGAGNTALGYQALSTNVSGGNNTAIGYGADMANGALNFSTAIGSNASVASSNTIVLGRNTDHTVIGATADDGGGANLQVTGKVKTQTLQVTTSPTSGYVLTSDSIGNATWQSPANKARTINQVSANFTVPTLTNDYLLNVDTTAAPITVTLGDGQFSDGFCIDVKNVGTATNAITVTSLGVHGAQTIDGSSSDTVSGEYDSKHYCAVGNNWFNY